MSQKLPALVFDLNPGLDFEIAWDFYRTPTFAGVDFWQEGAVNLHQPLSKLTRENNPKNFLQNYVDEIYNESETEFRNRLNIIEQIYFSKAVDFAQAVDKIFRGYVWPEGRYIAFGSIFAFGPRFLKEKSFQFFCTRKVIICCFQFFMNYYILFFTTTAKIVFLKGLVF